MRLSEGIPKMARGLMAGKLEMLIDNRVECWIQPLDGLCAVSASSKATKRRWTQTVLSRARCERKETASSK